MLYVQTKSCYKKNFLQQKHLEFTASKTPKSTGLAVINTSENWATWMGFGI